ncbi:TPA: HNH endonuclease [Serratia marcescens]|uniref:HNH endonuclease n=1 Tax=Serratia marcescens TaxID=615 RepID=UPI0011163C5B|nr:HNH endonuclease [Serratia marcescens]
MRKNKLTPHHLSNTEIILVPRGLHGNVPHIGSASDMRNGKNVEKARKTWCCSE